MGLFDDLQQQKSTKTTGLFDDLPSFDAATTATDEGKGVAGHLRDAGLSALKGAIAVPEMAVGLADIPTGGRVGKFLENEGGLIGFRPEEAKGILSDLHTDQYKAQQRAFADADGVMDKASIAVQNPSLITNTVIESLPSVGAGGVAGRGIATATRLGQMGLKGQIAAGAIGEGATMAGLQAEGIRQQTDDGMLTPEQSALSLGTGVLGTLFSIGGGRLAQKLGVGDIDTLAARGGLTPADVANEIAQMPAKSIPRKVIEGAVSEGLLEELPQSVSEQVLQNLALDKDWNEGVEDAVVMGTLAGMVMGGAAGAVPSAQNAAPAPTGGVDAGLIQPTPTPDNPAPAPVERPDPSNGPISAAAAKMASAQPAQNLPVPYVHEGDVLNDYEPNWRPGNAEPNIYSTATSEPAQLPPGTGQIDMGRDRPERTFAPTPTEYEGVGRNVVERQAGADALRLENRKTITQGEMIDLTRQFREAVTAKPASRTDEQKQLIKALPKLKQQVNAGVLPITENMQSDLDPQLAGQPIDAEWTEFAPQSGTLSVPRAQMPQVKAEHRGALVNFLNAKGVESEQIEVDPVQLKPTQQEFSPEKVDKARQYKGGERSILISSDGHVVDGHHQWMAKREKGEPVKAIQLQAPIRDLLPLVNQFPSSEQDAGTTPVIAEDAQVAADPAQAQTPRLIMRKQGQPFPSEQHARNSIPFRQSKGQAEIVPVEGGFAVQIGGTNPVVSQEAGIADTQAVPPATSDPVAFERPSFRIEPTDTSIRVMGDPQAIRQKLREGRFPFKGADIEGGLSFGKNQGDRIRSILGESVANEQALTEQASDQPEDVQTKTVVAEDQPETETAEIDQVKTEQAEPEAAGQPASTAEQQAEPLAAPQSTEQQGPVDRAVDAMRQVIETHRDVPSAVQRDDLGDIDFIWGDEGKSPTASGKRKGAKGVAHILEARMRKDGLSADEAQRIAQEVARVVVQGEVVNQAEVGGTQKTALSDGAYTAWLVKEAETNHWLLTGWEEIKGSDVSGKGHDKTGTTHSKPTPTRPEVGAEPSVTNIAQDEEGGQPASKHKQRAQKQSEIGSTITANGVTIEVPAIDQQLVDDYNRATHMGRGRDFNAELRSEAEGLLNQLAKRKYTLDTPEQKAEAKRLIEAYLQEQVSFMRWDARYSANNPSWIVTGRSGRNMDKSNRANERHMDEYTKRVDRLQAQRDRIGDTLYKMRPQEVQENQALTADLRNITQQAGHILGYLEEGKNALVAETRKWASPKAHKLIERSLDADRGRTIEHIRELENTKAVQDAGGLAKVFGPLSKAGRLIRSILNDADQNTTAPQNEAKQSGENSDDLPPILQLTRTRYINQEAKAQGIKKGSPGYADAIARIEDEYEADLDKAYAAISFEQYNALNSDTPESLNRQAWEGLRVAFGQSENDTRFSRRDDDNIVDPEYTPGKANPFWEGLNNGALRHGSGRSRKAQRSWVEERITAGHGFDRGRPRILAGTPGGGRETILFSEGIAGFQAVVTDGRVTQNASGQEVFTLRVMPPELMKGGANNSSSILTITLKSIDNNEYEVGILGPIQGGAAAQALAGTEYLSDTGNTSYQGLKYLKLNIGNAATKSFLSEAVRRLAMHIGKAPGSVSYPSRDTGARAGDQTARKFSRDIIESKFSRETEAESFDSMVPNDIGSPISRDQVEITATRITANWTNAPEMVTVATDRDLPADMQERIDKQNARGKIDGVFHKGRFYLIADKIRTEADVERIVLHEALGHYGLRQLYGPAFGMHMDRLFNRVGGYPGIQRLGKKYGFDLSGYWENAGDVSLAERREMMADELIAHIAGTGTVQPDLIQQIAHLVRQGLRKIMAGTRFAERLNQMTDVELLRIVAAARNAVVKGESRITVLTHDPRFVRDFETIVYGDARFSRVPDDAPVIETDGDTIAKGKTVKEMALRAREYARKHFAGRTVRNEDHGDDITIPMSGVRHTTFNAGEALLKTVAITPEILETSVYLGSEPDKSGNRNIKSVHYYGLKVAVDGELHDVVAVVKEDDKGHRYYDHSIEKKTGSDAHLISTKGASEPGAVEPTDPVSNSGVLSAAEVDNNTSTDSIEDDQDVRFSRTDENANPEESVVERAQRTLGNNDRNAWDKVKRTFKRNFTAAGLLPDSVFREKVLRDSEVNAHEFDTAHYIGALDRAISKAYGTPYRKLTDAQREAIDAQMKSTEPDMSIPEPVRVALMDMRRSIGGLSQQYAEILQQQVEELQAQGNDADAMEKAALLETIINNMDTYAHRSYRAFDDPDWPAKVSKDPEIFPQAVEYLKARQMEQGVSEAEAEQQAIRIARTILEEGTAYEDMSGFIKESKLGSKDLSTLKRRKDIAPEIRALLGEYKDVKINYAKTLAKMSRLVANTKLLDRIKEIGLAEGWLYTEDNKPLDQSVTKVAGDASEVYAPLNGYYVPNEINQALIDTLGKEQMADWLRAVIRMNGMVKYGKTVLSPTTAFRNWMSAAFFAMANGHFDITQMRKSVSGFSEYFGHGENPEKVAYLRKLKELGVVYDTAYAGEMMDLLKDSNLENTVFSKGPFQSLKAANELAQKFYQYGDDFWKIMGFENEKAMLMKHKGMSEAEAEVEAAERIRNTYPTYSMTGRAVNWLRRFPLAGTFVSFPAEVIRTQFHMLRYLKQDWKDSPAYAARKVVGLAMVSGLAYAAQALSKDLFDIGDDEEEAVRLMAASWNSNSNIWFMGRDEKGNIRYLDFSFLDPYNYFKRPINAVMRDQPLDKAAIQAANEMLSPFFGTDIAFGAISEIWNNKKEGGGRIYNPQDMALDQAQSIANHLRKAIQPGFVGNMERAWMAANDQVTASGKQYKAEEELAAFFGFRASTFDPKTALYYNSFEFKDRKRDATAVLMNVAKDPNSVSDGDLMKAYDTASRSRLRAYTDMIRLVEAARAAGMNNMQLNASLRRSGISKEDIRALMQGRIPAWRPDQRMMRNTIRKAELLYGPEVVREMREREKAIIQRGYRG